MDNQNFAAALRMYNEFGNYKDAKVKVKMCNYKLAEEEMKKGNDSEAAELFLKASGYHDAKTKYSEIIYGQGQELVKIYLYFRIGDK